ncbi:hypothetical protein BBO_01311 [Beauveria brongniartii RCEF 3172]|uniref:Uncharacterized protein n=1 Tax=Beauveria brongniartii RCEF 3172 TaxID=1081107 RepID=A0A167K8C6_9HYPO|nr:hypothetical protein BBO_01311 [Beauveria brongniartii RCEF 3172]
MAVHVDLSQRDMNVLEKMRDPDFNPEASLVLDERLPRDPHLTDPDLYDEVSARERAIIQSLQALESELAQTQAPDSDERAVAGYHSAITQLGALIAAHPRYASARNNRAQATRRARGPRRLGRAAHARAARNAHGPDGGAHAVERADAARRRLPADGQDAGCGPPPCARRRPRPSRERVVGASLPGGRVARPRAGRPLWQRNRKEPRRERQPDREAVRPDCPRGDAQGVRAWLHGARS